jgi:putative membrane protein
MMRTSAIACITLATALGLGLQAQTTSPEQKTKLSRQDKGFLTDAAEGNLAEVEMGKLGEQKSQNEKIKQFCQSIQKDHQAANQKLQPLAQSKGVQFPDSADFRHRHEMKRLEKLSGAEFDREFATFALKDHGKTISLFQKEIKDGEDADLKQFAQSTLPTLQQHMDMAKDAAKAVGVSETDISSIMKKYPQAVGGASTPGGQEQGTGSSKPSREEEKPAPALPK